MASMTEACIWRQYVDTGLPELDDFVLKQVPEPVLKDEPGQCLVELLYVSVDPYMRGRMRNTPGYFSPPFEPGKPLSGSVVARVKASTEPKVPEGTIVSAPLPWQQVQVVPAAELRPADSKLLSDLQLPASVYMGAMGMTGMTAYASLERIAKPKASDTVFVSGAAGAVGLMVGQLCKHVYGCTRVIGSAGSDEKVALLKEYGYDAGFNYKTTDTPKALKELAPDGISVYYDNVGGATLEAALDACNTHARVVACGSISGYNTPEAERYGVKNLFNIVTKRILMQGFIVGDLVDMGPQFQTDMSRYLREGKVKPIEHLVTGGLKQAGQAFLDLMHGRNIGKMVVQCAPDPYRRKA